MFDRGVDRPVRMLLATVLVTAPLLAIAVLVLGGEQVAPCLAPMPACGVHPRPVPIISTKAGLTVILAGLAICWLAAAVLLLGGLWRRRPELVLRLVGGVFMFASVAAVVGFGYGWLTGGLHDGAMDAAWFALSTMTVLFVLGVAIAALLTPQRRRRTDTYSPGDLPAREWERRSSG
jgi:hypothetical protein